MKLFTLIINFLKNLFQEKNIFNRAIKDFDSKLDHIEKNNTTESNPKEDENNTNNSSGNKNRKKILIQDKEEIIITEQLEDEELEEETEKPESELTEEELNNRLHLKYRKRKKIKKLSEFFGTKTANKLVNNPAISIKQINNMLTLANKEQNQNPNKESFVSKLTKKRNKEETEIDSLGEFD